MAKDEAKGKPLTPADCDLRHFKGMTIEIERLQRSKAWRICADRPELGFYMINLWLASWHEVPAASLPDDDEDLAAFARCKAERWPDVRGDVLRGWVKCSDGRLYHPIVAEVALKVLAKSREGARKAKKRWKSSSDDASAVPMQCIEGVEGKKEEESSSLRSEDSKTSSLKIDEGWALDEAAIEDGLSVGLSKAEIETAAEQHLSWWSANQPNARKTRDGWAQVWRARLDALADDPDQRARLTRKAASKPAKVTMRAPPPAPNVGEAPDWWVAIAALLRTHAPEQWTSWWSEVTPTETKGVVVARNEWVAADILHRGVAADAGRLAGFPIEVRRAA
jgi:hypothetical protein